MKEVYASLYLDKRRKKSNKKYPLKLRVFSKNPRKQKLYSTEFDFYIKDFDKLLNGQRLTNEEREIKTTIDALKSKADNIIKNLDPFTFRTFERKLFNSADATTSIKYHYEEQIKKLERNSQINTKISYELSRDRIKEFCESIEVKKDFDTLQFKEVDVDFLDEMEKYLEDTKGHSQTTISIYVRTLRAIFNKAIRDKDIDSNLYPFGRGRYIIPSAQTVKKALNSKQLKQLFELEPDSRSQELAKDFLFLSYSLNGMNIKDILELKVSDIDKEKIVYYRAKTKRTTKDNQKPIVVYLNDYSKKMIEKYGELNGTKDTNVFEILRGIMSPIEKQKKIKNFISSINKNLKRLCEPNGLPSISTYWARHSFATNSIRNGASMEVMRELLNHKNIKTTQGYFAGFEDEEMREFSKNLMNF